MPDALARALRSPVVILVGAVVVAWLASVPGAGQRTTRAWRGYETLLLDPSLAGTGGLRRTFGSRVVSEHTATVSFWSFTGIARVRLADLDARIDARDPRRDAVMNELPRYFHVPARRGGSWDVVYLRADRAPFLDFLQLLLLLGPPRGGSWRLLEFEPSVALVSLCGLAVFALLLALGSKGRGRARFAVAGLGACLWIPFLLGGGAARLSLALLLLWLWYRAVDVITALRGWDEKLLREARAPFVVYLAAAGAGLVVLIPAGGFCSGALLACAGPIAGSLLLALGLAAWWGRIPRRRGRKGFEPVPIMRPPPLALAPGQVAFLAALASILAVLLIPIAVDDPVPTAVPVAGVRDFSWRSLHRLAGREAGLPDASSLATHEAWEEGLTWGRPWGLPSDGERLYERRYLVTPRRIVAVEERVKVFDSTWLSFALAGRPGSIEVMLLDQQRATAVGLRGPTTPVLRELPVAVLVLVLLSGRFARPRHERSRGPSRSPLMRDLLLRFNDAARRNQAP